MIIGAGFSANAGLPLASQFTAQLLDVERLVSDGPSNGQVRFLKAFVDKIFGEGAERSADEWPEMEDILTLVDLSANTGHHLGPDFSPSQLRVVRRAIIVRMIRMLAQAYKRRQKSPDDNWRKLEALFGAFDLEKTAILSMNWDTVFEQGGARTQLVRRVDYGFEATASGRRRPRRGVCSRGARNHVTLNVQLLEPIQVPVMALPRLRTNLSTGRARWPGAISGRARPVPQSPSPAAASIRLAS